MSIEAMKQAIEAFEIAAEGGGVNFHAYAEELRQAIAEAEQEPVAWMYQCNADSSGPCFMEHKTNWAESGSGLWTETPLYTPQPKSEWVGLTDEDLYDCFSNDPTVAMKNAEQTLKKKNT